MNTKQQNRFYYALIILFLHVFFASFMLPAQTTHPVGAIPGTIDVSPMGATTYTIPIEVIPGTQGVQPHLSVVYNSMSGMGLLGMKWNLAGFSSISRCGQTSYYDDGYVSGIQFNEADRLCINGDRLLRVNTGSYWSSGGEYATEMENFTRVILYGGTPGHPEYFKAYTDDGSMIEYGYTSNSRQTVSGNKVLSWYINKVTDADGNYMEFEYETSGNELRIKQINYTKNESTSPILHHYAIVDFTYIDFSNALGSNTFFTGGYGISQTKLLETITVRYGSQTAGTVREYTFGYNIHDTGERTAHLKNIVLSDGNGKQFNETTIEWGDKSNNASGNFLFPDPLGYVLPGDFNGDGYMDYIIYGQESGENIWKYYEGPSYSLKGTGTHVRVDNGNSFFYKADVNGDGCDELLILERAYIYDMLLKVITFKNGIQQEDWCRIEDFENLFFGDFDGDGRVDMLFKSKDANNNNSFSFYIQSEYKESSLVLANSSSISNIWVGDVNADGREEIEMCVNNEIKRYSYDIDAEDLVHHSSTPSFFPSEAYSGDFNGDGITDILTYTIQGGFLDWILCFGKGDGTYTDTTGISYLNKQSESINWMTVPKHKILIADINGDSKDDIIQVPPGGGIVKILYSRGCFNGKYKYNEGTLNPFASTWDAKDVQFADVQNDGSLDFVIRQGRLGNIRTYAANSNTNKQYEFVKNITDGLDKKIAIFYRQKYHIASEDNVYSRKYFLTVVDSLRVSNGIGNGLNTLSYEYEFPSYSSGRRTFLGFEKFTIINHQSHQKSINISTRSIKYQILTPKETHIYINDQLVGKTENINVLQELGNRYVFNCQSTEKYDYLSNITTVTSNSFSGLGRLEASNTLTYDGLSPHQNDWLHSETTTYTSETLSLNGYQKKRVPLQILTTQQYSNSPNVTIVDTVTYGYYPTNSVHKGRLHWQRQGNVYGSISTQYEEYTSAGTFGRKIVSAAGVPSRREEYSYDPTYRFVTLISNPDLVGYETLFEYDPKNGNKLLETDVNGLETEYYYDSFGNLKQIIELHTFRTLTSTHWHNTSAKPENAKYYVQSTAPGKPTMRVYYDILGREVCSEEEGVFTDTRYNAKGEITGTSYPYLDINTSDDSKIWNVFTYDAFGRQSTEQAPYTDLSYVYENRKVMITDHKRNNITSWKDYDALGRLIQAKDAGGIINYSYTVINFNHKPRHRTQIITSSDNATTTIESDLWGNRLKLTEPNAGTITSIYNKFNELIKQTDAREGITTYQYDGLGRITQKIFDTITAAIGTGPLPEAEEEDGPLLSSTPPVMTIDYTYDNCTYDNKGRGKIYQVFVNNVLEETYAYNSMGSLSQSTKVIENIPYTFGYTYIPNTGQLATLTYPSGFAVTYSYDLDKLSEIRRSDHMYVDLIYKVRSRNKYHAPLRCEFGNRVATEYQYNDYGMVTQIKTGKEIVHDTELYDPNDPYLPELPTIPYSNGKGQGSGQLIHFAIDSSILNYHYTYNDRGLMTSRTESVVPRSEMFTYDNLDRLVESAVSQSGVSSLPQTFLYSDNGNIIDVSSLGTYFYHPYKRHAVTSIVGRYYNPNVTPVSETQCDVKYNVFHQPTKITEDDFEILLSYGSNLQRNKTEISALNLIRHTVNKYFERDVVNNFYNNERLYHYIYGDDGIVALHTQKSLYGDSMYYVHTDHLGSYCAVTSPSKQIVMSNRFDAWGNYTTRERAPYFQSYAVSNRGFTGHEHYPELKIINMNGRLYDPVIGRFFSPDKYVANSSFTQDFNRYTYARNNPLMYTDPSGQLGMHFGIAKGFADIMKFFINLSNVFADLKDQFNPPDEGVFPFEVLPPPRRVFLPEFEISVPRPHSFIPPSAMMPGGAPNLTGLGAPYYYEAQNTLSAPKSPSPSHTHKIGFMDGIQTGLDVVGLVPVVGEIADGVNAIIYTVRGDYISAGLSAAAMVPFLGWGATGTKLGIKAVEGVKGAHSVYRGVDAAGNTKYVGITGREPSVRFAEHAASKTARSALTYQVFDGATGLSKIEARIWEQQLINQHGLNNLLNLRNSIAPKYWWQYDIFP